MHQQVPELLSFLVVSVGSLDHVTVMHIAATMKGCSLLLYVQVDYRYVRLISVHYSLIIRSLCGTYAVLILLLYGPYVLSVTSPFPSPVFIRYMFGICPFNVRFIRYMFVSRPVLKCTNEQAQDNHRTKTEQGTDKYRTKRTRNGEGTNNQRTNIGDLSVGRPLVILNMLKNHERIKRTPTDMQRIKRRRTDV